MTRTAARILCERGRTAWPAGALLAEARKRAAKQDAKARKAASRKAAKAEAAWKQLPTFR